MSHFKVKSKSGSPTLLMRTRPDDNDSFVAFAAQGENFGAYVHRDALAYIAAAARAAAPNETIGLLAGRVCYDPQTGPYTLVMSADVARPGELEANPGYVHISAEGHARVRRRLEDFNPDREVVGWFHSHPTYTARFSPVDEREQATWSDPNHLGIVFSGNEPNEPFGVYRGPDSILLQQKRPLPATITQGRPTPPLREMNGPLMVDSPHQPQLQQPSSEQKMPPSPRPGQRPFTGTARDNVYKPTPPLPNFSVKRGVTVLCVIALLTAASLACTVWLYGRVRALEKRVGTDRPGAPGAATSVTPLTTDSARTVETPAGEASPSPPASPLDESPLASPTKSLAPVVDPTRARRATATAKQTATIRKNDVKAMPKKDATPNPKKRDKNAAVAPTKKEAEASDKKEDKTPPKESPKPTPIP